MKPSKSMITGSLLLGCILTFSLYGVSNSLASGRFEREYGEHEYEREYGREYRQEYRAPSAYAGQANAPGGQQYARYREECGSCHMAYPPALLPQQSWQAIMTGLAEHFGENAELDDESAREIGQFLQAASRPAGYGRLMRNMGEDVPLRITELPHFRHEHDEIPASFLRDNDKVTSLSQCNSCHKQAERGWFDEDSVYIPGIGRWDD